MRPGGLPREAHNFICIPVAVLALSPPHRAPSHLSSTLESFLISKKQRSRICPGSRARPQGRAGLQSGLAPTQQESHPVFVPPRCVPGAGCGLAQRRAGPRSGHQDVSCSPGTRLEAAACPPRPRPRPAPMTGAFCVTVELAPSPAAANNTGCCF